MSAPDNRALAGADGNRPYDLSHGVRTISDRSRDHGARPLGQPLDGWCATTSDGWPTRGWGK